MKTEKIYQKQVYLDKFEAKIESVISQDASISMVLDRTAFFPEGGGQPCDTGTIAGCKVIDVQEKDGIIYHKLVNSVDFKVGDTVSCTVDWDRRFDNMQRHCGEHILTGVIFREFHGLNKGFHMGEEYMTIDISFEDSEEYDELTWDMAIKAEELANELIWEDVPMITRHFDTAEEVKDIPVRKKVVLEEDITLVGIGSNENGWGCCACCGTHPNSTGQVGLIKVFRIEPNKGMWRIYFEAGKRALQDYRKRFDILTQISTSYSAGADDVIEKIAHHEEKQEKIRSDYFALRQAVIKDKAKLIQEEINDGKVHIYTEELLKADDIRNMAKQLTFKGIVMFCDVETLTVLMFSDGSYDCGSLIKNNAPVFSGKGGGRKENAQAKFTSKENMYLFADAIEKLQR